MVFVFVHQQSKDIAGGVDQAWNPARRYLLVFHVGAGDQGVYGSHDDVKNSRFLVLMICRKLDSTMKKWRLKGSVLMEKPHRSQLSMRRQPKRIKNDCFCAAPR